MLSFRAKREISWIQALTQFLFLLVICRKQHIAAICGFKRFLATPEMTSL